MNSKEELQGKSLRYNEGKVQWSLVDFKSLEPFVRVLEFGKSKYGKDNWKVGMDLDEILDSGLRHMTSLSNGKVYDDETKLMEAGHVIANMMFWMYHYNKQNETK